MNENRTINEEYSEIAHDLIESEDTLKYIKDSQATIIYLGSDREKKSRGRVIFGECERIPDKYKWAVPCDFTITLYEPNIERFTEEQLRVLILHELLHVGIEQDGNEEQYFVIPHDIEDFRLILERYGMEWNYDKA